ncbi:MAG: PEP-CTERM sorting domain-containing protein [Spirulinaceae cyanobacterium]
MSLRNSFSVTTIVTTLVALISLTITPVQAAIFSLEFNFNNFNTGELVKGNFIFNNSVAPVVTNFGSLYQKASLSFEIFVGEKIFTGLNNSLVVADNFENSSGITTDVLIFDGFEDFDPNYPDNYQSLALFNYSQDSWTSEDLPPEISSTGLVLLNLAPGVTVFSPNAFTSIKAWEDYPPNTSVPEPSSILGLIALGTFSTMIKKRQN